MAISAYRGFLFLVRSDGKSQTKAKLAKTWQKRVYQSTNRQSIGNLQNKITKNKKKNRELVDGVSELYEARKAFKLTI